MHRRLLLSTVLVALICVVVLGVPLGIVANRLIRDEAQKRMNRDAATIAQLVESRSAAFPLTAAALARYTGDDRQAVVQLANGSTLTAGEHISGPAEKGTAVGSAGERVTVTASASETDDQIATMWAVVGGLGVVVLALAVVLARVQARRIVRPVADLVAAAERLGSGDGRPATRRYGIRELDQVAVVLDSSAVRISQLLGAERQLAADASHQLRTPLTALSIRLEEILAMSDDEAVREEAAAALVQAERLASVVDSLLARARTSHTSSVVLVDVDEVLDQQLQEWAPAFRRAGRAVRIDGRRGLKAYATPGGLASVVATLLDNSLTHGSGAVTMHTRDAGGHIVVEVGDEGPGVPEHLVPEIFRRTVSGGSGTGIGLALARSLVESDGGRLELVHARPPVFAIFLSPDRGS